MGFGAALAMGLVQGFTKNIEEEKARRQAEYQKIDDLNTLMFDAAAKGDLNPTNATLLKGIIQNARGELDAKERIDIFGRASTPVDIDITEVAPLLQKTEDEDSPYTSEIVVGKDTWGVYTDFIKNPNPNSARVFLGEVGANMSQSQFQAMIANNPEMYQTIHNQAVAAMSIINNQHQDRMSKATEGQSFPTPTFNDPGLSEFMKFGTQMYNMPTLEDINAETTQTALTNVTGQEFDSVLIMPDGAAGITFDTENKKEALAIISNQMNVPVTKLPQFFADTYFEDAAEFGGTNKYVLVDGMINLGEAFLDQNVEIKALDPDKGLYRLDPTQSASYYEIIVQNAGGEDSTFAEQTYILAPYMSAEKKKTTNMVGFQNTSSGRSRESYVMLKATQFSSFGEMEAARNTLIDTNDQLAAFRERREQMDSPTAYEELKKVLRFTFGGDGFFASAARDMGFFEGSENSNRTLRDGEKYVDEAYVNSLSDRVEQVRQEKGETYAEFEALRITLAFQMARAADPSGRLSNQDIEQQLVKLGTSFDTKDMALAKIDMISKEFKTAQDRLDVLVKYGKGTDIIDVKGQAIIDAAISVGHMRMERDRINYLNQSRGQRIQSYADMDRVPSTQYQGAFVVINPAGLPVQQDNRNVLVDSNGNVLSRDNLVPIEPGEQPAAAADSTVTLPTGEQAEVPAESAPEAAAAAPETVSPAPEGSLDATKETTTGGNNASGWTLKNREGKWKYDSTTQTFVPFQQAS